MKTLTLTLKKEEIMPQSFMNFGTNFATWIAFIAIVITLIFAYFFMNSLHQLSKAYSETDEKITAIVRKSAIRNALMTALFFVICIIFFYFSFGSGRPPRIHSIEEDGMRNMVERMPKEKAKKVIKEEAYQKKPEELKRQDDPGFKQEVEQADGYIKKALEKDRIQQQSNKGESND